MSADGAGIHSIDFQLMGEAVVVFVVGDLAAEALVGGKEAISSMIQFSLVPGVV